MYYAATAGQASETAGLGAWALGLLNAGLNLLVVYNIAGRVMRSVWGLLKEWWKQRKAAWAAHRAAPKQARGGVLRMCRRKKVVGVEQAANYKAKGQEEPEEDSVAARLREVKPEVVTIGERRKLEDKAMAIDRAAKSIAGFRTELKDLGTVSPVASPSPSPD